MLASIVIRRFPLVIVRVLLVFSNLAGHLPRLQSLRHICLSPFVHRLALVLRNEDSQAERRALLIAVPLPAVWGTPRSRAIWDALDSVTGATVTGHNRHLLPEPVEHILALGWPRFPRSSCLISTSALRRLR